MVQHVCMIAPDDSSKDLLHAKTNRCTSCTAFLLHLGSHLENSRDVGVEQVESPVDAVGIKVKRVSITMPCTCRPPQLPQVRVIKASHIDHHPNQEKKETKIKLALQLADHTERINPWASTPISSAELAAKTFVSLREKIYNKMVVCKAHHPLKKTYGA